LVSGSRAVTGGPARFVIATIPSEKTETDFDHGDNRYRFAVFIAGAEPPLSNGIHGLLIQTQSQTVEHSHVSCAAARIHLDIENYYALIFGLARLLGVFG